jgi:NADH-quinone oxidoreductase subunit G
MVRGEEGMRVANLNLNGTELKIAVVHGLKNAREIAASVMRGESEYDLIEVMACPGGCIGGAGQPVTRDNGARKLRTRGLYDVDKNLDLHKSQENHHVTECYQKFLGEIGGHKAHELLHTSTRTGGGSRTRTLLFGAGPDKLRVGVCVGTNCFLKGSQQVLHGVLEEREKSGLQEKVGGLRLFLLREMRTRADCAGGADHIEHCTAAKARAAIKDKLET